MVADFINNASENVDPYNVAYNWIVFQFAKTCPITSHLLLINDFSSFLPNISVIIWIIDLPNYSIKILLITETVIPP